MADVRLTEGSLAKVGVDLLDKHRIHLQCQYCGALWSPNLQRGGKLPRGWWKCPNGCNKSGIKEHLGEE